MHQYACTAPGLIMIFLTLSHATASSKLSARPHRNYYGPPFANHILGP